VILVAADPIAAHDTAEATGVAAELLVQWAPAPYSQAPLWRQISSALQQLTKLSPAQQIWPLAQQMPWSPWMQHPWLGSQQRVTNSAPQPTKPCGQQVPLLHTWPGWQQTSPQTTWPDGQQTPLLQTRPGSQHNPLPQPV
jgi:hypothetical protein